MLPCNRTHLVLTWLFHRIWWRGTCCHVRIDQWPSASTSFPTDPRRPPSSSARHGARGSASAGEPSRTSRGCPPPSSTPSAPPSTAGSCSRRSTRPSTSAGHARTATWRRCWERSGRSAWSASWAGRRTACGISPWRPSSPASSTPPPSWRRPGRWTRRPRRRASGPCSGSGPSPATRCSTCSTGCWRASPGSSGAWRTGT